MPYEHEDVIDVMLGTIAGEGLDRLRAGRPDARKHAQASYEVLLTPTDPKDFAVADRMLVAAFVAALAGVPQAFGFYSARAALPENSNRIDAVIAEARRAAAAGPYGTYRGGLAAESVDGPEHLVTDLATTMILPDKMIAALEYAHFLVFHPRDASRQRLQTLLDAGWTVDGIVTLSQLVAFLSFQLRVVAGLGALQIATGEAA